jgi:serpin B
MSINVALLMLFEGTGSTLRSQMSEILHYSTIDHLRHTELRSFLRAYNISADETEAEKLEILKTKQEESSHVSGGWQRGPKPKPFSLVLANSIWPSNSYTIKRTFTQTLQTWYNSSVTSLNYAGDQNSYQQINNWISAKTNGKISNILQPLPRTTSLILVNAIYFKANWLYQFEKSRNYTQTFHNTLLSTDENPTGPKVTYMVSKKKSFNYYQDSENNLFVEMPYAEGPKGNISMVVMLPALGGSVAEFSMAKLGGVQKLLSFRDLQEGDILKVELHLPKFKLETELELTKSCRAMGLGRMFSPGPGDFSGITDRDDIAVNSIIHQAFIEVDENGTEAAAATVVIMMKMAMPM